MADFADRAGVPVVRIASLDSVIHPAFERPSLIILDREPPCLPLGLPAGRLPDEPCVPTQPSASPRKTSHP